jgi:predicted nucleic acid-binding protein
VSKDIDLKIVYEFTNKYEKLKNEGKISEEDFQKILSLLDDMDQLSKKELENKLKDVT